MKKVFFGLMTMLLLLMTVGSALAYVANSSNYQLEKDSLNFGGTDFSFSANYLQSDTLGEIVSGLLTGTSYNASSGYRYLETDALVVLGCTDATANNYNSLATQDDGSCTHGSGGGGTILPPHEEVMGCTDPEALNYNSQATRDDGNCEYRHVEDSILGCINPLATNYNSVANEDDGSCEYPSDIVPPIPPTGGGSGVFGYLPLASTSMIVEGGKSADWEFRFIQPSEVEKTFDNRMKVWVLGEKNLTIVFNYKLDKTTLKTIGVTITDPIDKTKTFSFLMHRNKEGTAYEATIAPLIRKGTYPVDFYIINYDNQTVRHIKGNLITSGVMAMLINFVKENAVPIAATTGLAVGIYSSLYDLFVVFFRAFGSFFGRKRKDNPWGTVYDSVTKRPLDPVYLTVNQGEKEISMALTDIDGRFNFFLPAGIYTIKANKTHYRFPSERLAGKTADELYNHLYFGGDLTSNGEAVIDINIPMDPIDFDWNEFAKTKKNFFEFYNRRTLWLNRLYKLIFTLGFILSIYACFIFPSIFNFVILSLYFGLLALNRFWHNPNKPLQIVKESTKEPMPFAIVRLFLPDLNQQIKYAVADKFGKFFLLVRPGVYYYTVEEKQTDGTYLKVFQSKPVNLPKGVLTANITI
jgi:hypothetical protein